MDVDGLVSEYLPMARSIAAKHQRPGLDPDELESSATAALWQAARRYDPELGDFGPWARVWITRALASPDLDATVETGGIKIPLRLRRARAKVRRAQAELLSLGVNRPSIEEIADLAQLDVETVREVRGLPSIERLPDESGS